MIDMRKLMDAARDDAPPPRLGVDDIVKAAHRRKRWMLTQRVGGAGVVAAAMVTGLVLVGSNLALPGGGTRTDVADVPHAKVEAERPTFEVSPFTFTFNGYGVGDYRVLPPQEVNTTQQHASILLDYRDASGKATTAYVGNLTVFRPGVALGAAFGSGTKLTVQGREAYQIEMQVSAVTINAQNGAVLVTDGVAGKSWTQHQLAWKYADNAWAVIRNQPDDTGHDLPAEVAVSLANGFSTSSPVQARLPFQLGYLPAGWRLEAVSGRSFAAEDVGTVSARYAQPDPASDTSSGQRAGNAGPAVQIAIGQQDAPPPDAPKKKDRCSADENWCSWPIPGTRFYLSVSDPSRTLSTEELLRIGQGLAFDNLDDPSTWHPVA